MFACISAQKLINNFNYALHVFCIIMQTQEKCHKVNLLQWNPGLINNIDIFDFLVFFLQKLK